ncbi:predicted membrane carboxypeptidase (penicillin-binding protein) [gamma proteobacterium HdN1]|nr:predicted membrane carboxypeptidase (penicillin-binding protein) [gamma proteobacterium HdN1]
MGVLLPPVPMRKQKTLRKTPAFQRRAQAAYRPIQRMRGVSIFKISVVTLIVGAAGVAGIWGWNEAKTSAYQSKELSNYASSLSFTVEPGPSDNIRYPVEGPFDERLGYVRLPQMLERLQARGYSIQSQARFSPELMRYTTLGLFPPFPEKDRAGLDAKDCRNEQIYKFTYPRRGYRDFNAIPDLIAQSLLFIENRTLLDERYRRQNPAVDWGRFGKAAASQAAKLVGAPHQSMGGSTLATQIEKYRHSPDGVTSAPTDKILQMASASVRAYQQGPDTMAARRTLVLSYLNTVPLSAAPGYGEVNGLGDGLYVWFGADFDTVNRVLSSYETPPEGIEVQATALREVIALMIAHRRPTWYLARGRSELERLTDSYIRIMAKQGAISWTLREAALKQPLTFRNFTENPATVPMETNKGVNVVRRRLNMLLNIPNYDLDRLDLAVTSTLQRETQEQISDYLAKLANPDFAREMGLFGERLLKENQAGDVHYSFVLFERTPDGNQVRIQTDNTDQPFDINESSKLELGSTAKLRVLTTYLEIITELHEKYSALAPAELTKARNDASDILSQWVLGYLSGASDKSLHAILAAAMERSYSANPGERFFTGGGMHVFNNFRREDNGRMPTVRESLQESINLPFVRMLRDIVKHIIANNIDNNTELLKNDSDPRRKAYLTRFADREGMVFLNRFWNKYKGKDSTARMEILLDGIRRSAPKLAAIHRYVFPNADLETFSVFLRTHLPNTELKDKYVADLYDRYGPGKFNLPDQGYIARVHPLELWLLAYLEQQPEINWGQAAEASEDERQEVYGWLFKTRAKNARDSRIRTMLEVEAFMDLHQRWARLGYPFGHLVPSYATALGSSGDRPAALAELMGIILNGGKRFPTVRIQDLHFGAGTPYDTDLARSRPVASEQVLNPEVAATLKQALSEVVSKGTARRLTGGYTLADGSTLVMGGKTGTGDNRLVTGGPSGRHAGTALNRTATFVFYLGDNHFGTLTAFVPGKEAAAFRFTSALPVQAMKGMAPILLPYLEPTGSGFCGTLAPSGASESTLAIRHDPL